VLDSLRSVLDNTYLTTNDFHALLDLRFSCKSSMIVYSFKVLDLFRQESKVTEVHISGTVWVHGEYLIGGLGFVKT
jgi:hypothetical protein